jgi:hypothetical protein
MGCYLCESAERPQHAIPVERLCVKHRAEYERSFADAVGPVQVSGRVLTVSLTEFEHRCLVYLAAEQIKPSPDTALIGLLCDSVRLAREYTDSRK